MKKKVLSFLLACAITVTGVPGVGPALKAEAKDKEGSVLNIYSWNEEFKDIVEKNYPGYEAVDYNSGRIGDVTVNWNIISTYTDDYRTNLDMKLAGQSGASADDKIDMFLIEPDYAQDYLDTDYVLPVDKLGIKKNDMKDQFKYTKTLGSDSKGVLKALTWQCCPGTMIYNREIAKKVLGTDDPKKVQKYVSSWDKYNETAVKMVKKGYMMTATAEDSFRVYFNNTKAPWVKKGKIKIDKNVEKWAKDSKKLIDKGATTSGGMWFDQWTEGFYGNVFCYFGPKWFVDWCMHESESNSVAYNGGWAVTEGPQNFFWGSSFICAAKGTDNPTLVGNIMKTLTCDKKVMKNIAENNGDFVNNQKSMAEISAEGYKSNALGGQNPMPYYIKCAKKLKAQRSASVDTDCQIHYSMMIQDYFADYASYDQTLNSFYSIMKDLYPELRN